MKTEGEVKLIAEQVQAPLNILSLPGLTNASRLGELGVKRLSIGNAFFDQIADFMEIRARRMVVEKDSASLFETSSHV